VTASTSAGFNDALRLVAGVEGWMTDDQARRLWDRAATVRSGGQIVEIGSYRGRSAIVLARAAGGRASVVAIDPHAGNDRGPQQIYGTVDEGDTDNHTFVTNLRRAGVSDQVRHVRLPSQDAGREVSGAIDMLYIDGAHRYGPARDDIDEWGARVADDGTMLIHDSFSSVGVTAALIRLLFASGRFLFVGRVGSLAEYRREPVRGAARLRNLGRQLAQVPWFLRNVIVKVLLVLRLKPLTRLLGHRTGEWPY